jgi:hypothetical protein
MPKKIIEALPGRMILKFPDPAKEAHVQKGLLYIPADDQEELDVAEIVSLGDPTSEEERMFVRIVAANPNVKVKANPNWGIAHRFTDENGEKRELRIFRMFEAVAIVRTVE